MAITLDQLGEVMDGLSRLIKFNSRGMKQRAARVAVAALVRDTPIDTGLAKSNWLASVNQEDDSTVDIRSDSETVSAAEDVIRGAGDDDTIVIQNNLDYIERLNEGYSGQAPAGFVQSAIQEAAATVASGKVVD